MATCTLINPRANGRQLLVVSKIMILCYTVLMGKSHTLLHAIISHTKLMMWRIATVDRQLLISAFEYVLCYAHGPALTRHLIDLRRRLIAPNLPKFSCKLIAEECGDT